MTDEENKWIRYTISESLGQLDSVRYTIHPCMLILWNSNEWVDRIEAHRLRSDTTITPTCRSPRHLKMPHLRGVATPVRQSSTTTNTHTQAQTDKCLYSCGTVLWGRKLSGSWKFQYLTKKCGWNLPSDFVLHNLLPVKALCIALGIATNVFGEILATKRDCTVYLPYQIVAFSKAIKYNLRELWADIK